MTRRNICLLTERLYPPFDEGYKNFTYHLFCESAAAREVLRLGSGDPSVIDVQVRADKLLLSADIRRAIRDFRPDLVVYVPVASATPASFLRARTLRSHARGAPVVMIGLQPRLYPACLRPILRAVAPDRVYVQSEASRRVLEAMGINAGVVHAGVDGNRFRPVEASEKARLRAQHGVASDAYVVVHVGHINERRNLRVMADVASATGMQAVVVGSTSTPQDVGLAASLRESGVIVLDGYLERIEEVYQLADLYVFPVFDDTGAVEMPLSVLEAMSCDLPIASTRFGGLTDRFGGGEGVFYAESSKGFVEQIERARQFGEVRNREKVAPYTWPAVVEAFLRDAEELTAR